MLAPVFIDRATFFRMANGVTNAATPSESGPLTLRFDGEKLLISCEWGSCEMAARGETPFEVIVPAGKFAKLVKANQKKKSPHPEIRLTVNGEEKRLTTAEAGINCRIVKL